MGTTLEDQKISRIQEIQRLEDEKYNFIGLELPKDQLNEEIKNATNFWLGSVSIEHLVNLYLQDIIGAKQEVILGKETLKTMRLSTDTRAALLADYRKYPFRKKEINLKWERWLQGSNQYLPVTFESECAANNPNAVFLAPFHPFVQQAARHFTINEKAVACLEVLTDKVKPGIHFFAIYRWKYMGVREDRCFKIITDDDELDKHIDLLLKEAKDSLDENANITEQIINDFNSRHYAVWETAKNKHLKENERFINYQRQSLILSHNARITLLNERLMNVQDEQVRRMHQGEIRKAEADYARHLKIFDEAQKKIELKFTPVIYGSLRLTGEPNE